MSLKKWHEVYSNSDEQKFFIGKDGKSGLVRSQYDFRSVAALAKEAGLTKDRTEQIIDKFVKMGVVIVSPNKEDHYGYWQRVSPNLGSAVALSVSAADQGERVKKASSKKP